MRGWMLGGMMATTLAMIGAAGCGTSGGCKEDPGDPTATFALSLGKQWNYDVVVSSTTLAGLVKVDDKVDVDYAHGIESLKVEVRENQLLVATRWYQVKSDGLYLLGEEVQEGASVAERTYVDAVQAIPFPLQPKCSDIPQRWSTTTDLVQGGNETHRWDNLGQGELTVPAGTVQAFHFVQNRTITGGDPSSFDEYFVPGQGYVQFEFPEGDIWKLKP